MNKFIKFMGLMLIVTLSGCINGPVRCYLNGPYDYLMVETAKRCPVYAYPVALPAAAVCDVGIIAVDTIWVPLGSLACLVRKDCGGPFMLPFYPLICVMVGGGTFWTGIGDYRDGVLYQRLFGMSYIKTKYGKFKIINVKKQDGSQDTKLVFNEQTVYLLPGKLINFTNNADNVVAGTSDGSVFWWQQIDGKWQYKPFVLVPEKIKLAKAIDEKIEDLKSSISVYNSNSYERKSNERIEKQMAWWKGLKICLENSAPVVKEVISQPRFGEDKSKVKQEGTWSLSYTLRLHCQLYDFDVICNTDGTGWDIIRVDHYFFETFFEEVEKDK